MEQTPQERLIVANRRQLGDHSVVEFGRVSRGEVVQSRILQPTPQSLDRVEYRRERRQTLQLNRSRALGLGRAFARIGSPLCIGPPSHTTTNRPARSRNIASMKAVTYQLSK